MNLLENLFFSREDSFLCRKLCLLTQATGYQTPILSIQQRSCNCKPCFGLKGLFRDSVALPLDTLRQRLTDFLVTEAWNERSKWSASELSKRPLRATLRQGKNTRTHSSERRRSLPHTEGCRLWKGASGIQDCRFFLHRQACFLLMVLPASLLLPGD